MTDPIVKTVIVNAAREHAFDVFVNRISTWWPLDANAVSAGQGKAALAVTIEPHVGGAVFETMFDGTRTEWGEVLVFAPGEKLAMSWHPGTNGDVSTRVDVAFENLDEKQTRVTLTHSGWEVMGEEADQKRGHYSNGWDVVFIQRFAGALAD